MEVAATIVAANEATAEADSAGGWASLKIQGAFFLASTPAQMEAGSEGTDVYQLEFVWLDGLG